MKQRWLVTLVILSTFSYSVEAYNYAARYRIDQDESERLEEMAERLGMPVEKLRREQPGLVDALKGLFQNPEEATRQAGMARVEAQLKKMSEQVASNPYRPGIEDVKNAYRGHQLDGLLRDLSQLTSTRVIELPVASRKALLRSLRASLEEELLPYVPDDLPGKGKGRHNQLKGKLSSLYAKLRPILSHPDALSDDKLAQTLGKVAAEVNELVKRPERGPRFADGRPLPLQFLAKGMPTQESTAPATGSSSALVQAPAPARRMTAPVVAPEVSSLVQSLGGSPARIFGHVHDTIRFDPKWGAVRSPLGTLQEGEGTSWDQAWLLLEMLTAAGVDAKLEWGQVEIPVDLLLTLTGTSDPIDAGTLLTTGGVPGVLLVQGGKVVGARLSHVWVQAHIDYIPNRGVTPGEGDTWIRMDPSFKRYGFSPGIDAHSYVPFSLESYLRSGTPMSPRRAYEDALWSYIRANNIPCTTLEQLKKSAEVKRERFPFVPGTLRGKILRSDGTSPTMPEAFQQRLALEVRTAGGAPLVSWSSPAPALHGRRVEITYVGATSEDQATIDAYGGIFETPPYLVDLKPTVRVAGTVVAGAGAVGAGSDTEVWVTTTPPSGAPTVVSHATSAGERHVLAVDFGELPQTVIDAHQQALNAALATGNEAEAEAESLYLLGAQYLHNLGRDLTDLSGWKWQRLVRLGTEGLISQTGVVTTTVGGAPISFRRGERNVDIARMPLGMVPADGREQGARESFELLGAQSSYLEGEVFNQVLQREGIASVSALTRAKREGQELARVDGANMDAVLSQVDLGADAEAEVRAAVSRGRIAWVAESRLSIHQWRGTGYVLEDPDTGEAAYLISGGYGGGSDTGGGVGGLQDLLGTEGWLEGSPFFELFQEFRDILGDDSGEPGTQKSDPVNLSTGNLWRTETDFTILARGLPVLWSRTYNSRSSSNGPLGFGWSFTYGQRLEEQADGSVIYLEEDGTDHRFALASEGYESPPGKHLSLAKGSAGFTLRDKDGAVIEFALDGRLLSLGDRNGNFITLNYDASGHLQTVSDAGGRTVLTITTIEERIVQVTDLAGRSVVYSYSGDDLTQVTDTVGKVWSYAYDGEHNLVAKSDPLGNTDTYAYDALDRCHRHTDALGQVETFAYTSQGERGVVTDRRGFDTYVELDERGRALLQVDPMGNAARSEWDEDNNRTSTVDPRGGVTARTYDDRGNLLSETNPLDQTTSFTYDPVFDELLTKTDAAGHTVSFTYDARGNLVRATQVVAGAPLEETFIYDAYGHPVEQKDANGNSTFTSWDPVKGTLESQTDAAGQKTVMTTDALGRVIEVEDPAGNTISVAWDGKDRLQRILDPHGNETSLVYDDAGRPSRLSSPRGTTVLQYDAAGRVVQSQDSLGTVVRIEFDASGKPVARIDARGNRTAMTYDAVGRPLSFQDALGRIWSYGHCAEIGACTNCGNDSGAAFCELTDPRGNTTVQDFDALGRVTRITDPLGNTSQITFDALGRKASVTDPLQRTTRYEYDEKSRLKAVVEADGARTEYVHDLNGNLTRVKDAEGRIWPRAYDELNRLKTESDPLGHTTTYTYDALGNLKTKLDPDGRLLQYEYDVKRLMAVVLPDESRETFQYDALGRPTGMSNAEVSLTYVFDALDRVVQETNHRLGQTLTYEYDAAGNRTKMNGPNGTATFLYDAANRLAEQRDPATGIYRFSYDELDRRTELRYPNGVTTAYEYDVTSRLLSTITRNGQSQVVDGYSYTYDAAGQRTGMMSLRDSLAHTYEYDSLGRLAEWHAGANRFENYRYDRVGNRTGLTDERGHVTYSHDDANHLLSELRDLGSGGTATTGYEWDGSGRLVRKTTGSVAFTYEYDPLDRLVRVEDAGGLHSYGYDPMGNRVRSTDGPSTKLFLHSKEDVVAAFDTAGSMKTYVTHGPGVDEPLAQMTAAVSYLHMDGLGSITAQSSVAGQIAGFASYSPFGSVESSSGMTAMYGYTARELDSTGLMYYRARYYQPTTGMFTSADSFQGMLSDPPSQNLYTYVRGNPISFTDPSGHVPASGWVKFLGMVYLVISAVQLYSILSFMAEWYAASAGLSFLIDLVVGAIELLLVGVAMLYAFMGWELLSGGSKYNYVLNKIYQRWTTDFVKDTLDSMMWIRRGVWGFVIVPACIHSLLRLYVLNITDSRRLAVGTTFCVIGAVGVMKAALRGFRWLQ